MSDENSLNGSPMELMPYQNQFLDMIFSPTCKKTIFLHGDVGLGKSITLVALCSRFLHEQPTARVLFLVPAILRTIVFDRLRVLDTPALLVDRYKFREMLDSATDDVIWHPGVAAVLSVDFAKQPDIQESLLKAHWDLVIADEAHIFKGARAEVLRSVGASATRIVLATATNIDQSDLSILEDATVVDWHRDQLVGLEGRPFSFASRPVLHEIPFGLSLPERKLLETLRDLCRNLENGTHAQSWFAKSLMLRAMSSPAALEGSLQRQMIRHRTEEHRYTVQGLSEGEQDEGSQGSLVDILPSEETTGLATHVLQEIENITVDSKLDTFMTMLERINDDDTFSQRICVLTSFMDTLYYLSAEIDSRGQPYQLLHSGLSFEDRQNSLQRFSTTSSILLATIASSSEGIDLSEVTHLVLYDLPASKITQQQVLGRFDRVGRTSQLHVYAFVSQENVGNADHEPLHLLRQALNFEPGVLWDI